MEYPQKDVAGLRGRAEEAGGAEIRWQKAGRAGEAAAAVRARQRGQSGAAHSRMTMKRMALPSVWSSSFMMIVLDASVGPSTCGNRRTGANGWGPSRQAHGLSHSVARGVVLTTVRPAGAGPRDRRPRSHQLHLSGALERHDTGPVVRRGCQRSVCAGSPRTGACWGAEGPAEPAGLGPCVGSRARPLSARRMPIQIDSTNKQRVAACRSAPAGRRMWAVTGPTPRARPCSCCSFRRRTGTPCSGGGGP